MRARDRLGVAVLLLLAGGAFAPGLAAWFGADDFFFVAHYRGSPAPPVPSFIASALSSLADVPTTFYRPLAFLMLGTELKVWGESAPALRAMNLVLHAATTLLVFTALRSVARGPHAAAASLIAAAGFTLFPRRVEPVMWLSCRPDLLAGAFAAAMLVVVLRCRWSWRTLAALSSLYALTLLSKEAAIGVPLVIAVCAWRRHGRREAVAAAIGLGTVVCAYLAWRRHVLGGFAGGYGAGALEWSPAMPANAAKYLAYLAIPPLEFLTPAHMRAWPGTLAGIGVLVVAGALVTALWWRRDDDAVRIGGLWMAVTAVPVVLPAVSLTTPFNDRLLYVPAIGFAVAVTGVLSRAPRRTLVAVLPLLLLYGAHEWRMVQRWPLAGDITKRMLTGLVTRERQAPEGALVVTALPDSYGGAYVLRNGYQQALGLVGARHPERVWALALYMLERPGVVPVRAVVTPATSGASMQHVCITSLGPIEQVIPLFESRLPGAALVAPDPTDRFGRRMWLAADVPAGPIWFVSTDGDVRPVRSEATVTACGPS